MNEVDRGCGNCQDIWLERACLGTIDGEACKDWIRFTDMDAVAKKDRRQDKQEETEEETQ